MSAIINSDAIKVGDIVMHSNGMNGYGHGALYRVTSIKHNVYIDLELVFGAFPRKGRRHHKKSCSLRNCRKVEFWDVQRAINDLNLHMVAERLPS